MAVLVTETHDPFSNGLGKASNLGTGFLRKVTIDLNGAATTKTLTPANLGCAKFLSVISIVPKSVGPVYLSAFSESSLTVTANANTDVIDLVVLVSGM